MIIIIIIVAITMTMKNNSNNPSDDINKEIDNWFNNSNDTDNNDKWKE